MFKLRSQILTIYVDTREITCIDSELTLYMLEKVSERGII